MSMTPRQSKLSFEGFRTFVNVGLRTLRRMYELELKTHGKANKALGARASGLGFSLSLSRSDTGPSDAMLLDPRPTAQFKRCKPTTDPNGVYPRLRKNPQQYDRNQLATLCANQMHPQCPWTESTLC